jgi:hypothetical protein
MFPAPSCSWFFLLAMLVAFVPPASESFAAESAQTHTDAIEAGGPQPRLAGPLMSDGRRVAAEIFIDLSDGSTLHVVDMFLVENGRIQVLNYFTADEPAVQ